MTAVITFYLGYLLKLVAPSAHPSIGTHINSIANALLVTAALAFVALCIAVFA